MKKSPDFFITTPQILRARRASVMKNSRLTRDFFITPQLMDMWGTNAAKSFCMQLNLRDLFWVMFVAAMLTMWWLDHSRMANLVSFYQNPKPVSSPPSSPAVVPIMAPSRVDPEVINRMEEWERKWFAPPTPEEMRRAHQGVI